MFPYSLFILFSLLSPERLNCNFVMLRFIFIIYLDSSVKLVIIIIFLIISLFLYHFPFNIHRNLKYYNIYVESRFKINFHILITYKEMYEILTKQTILFPVLPSYSARVKSLMAALYRKRGNPPLPYPQKEAP